MPEPPTPPDAPQGAGPGAAMAHHKQPLFAIDSMGERVGAVAMVVLMLGSLLPWGDTLLWGYGPLAVSALTLVPLSLGLIAFLQVASTASRGSTFIIVSLASLTGLVAVAARAGDALALRSAWGSGMPVALLGVLLGLVAMEMLRREAGLRYEGVVKNAIDLALQPRVQKALLKLLIPFALVGILVFAVLELYGEAVAGKLGLVFLTYFFNPIGKEVAIPLALSGAVPPVIDPVLTWVFIVFIDVTTALFLVWNYDHVLKVPFVGRFFTWVERKGNAVVQKRKWIARLAFFGLAIYATLPLEGTGAIGGSVVGRAIGLSPTLTFLAVGTGSVIRTSLTTLIVLGALQVLGL